jgi:hypothetical protein
MAKLRGNGVSHSANGHMENSSMVKAALWSGGKGHASLLTIRKGEDEVGMGQLECMKLRGLRRCGVTFMGFDVDFPRSGIDRHIRILRNGHKIGIDELSLSLIEKPAFDDITSAIEVLGRMCKSAQPTGFWHERISALNRSNPL